MEEAENIWQNIRFSNMKMQHSGGYPFNVQLVIWRFEHNLNTMGKKPINCTHTHACNILHYICHMQHTVLHTQNVHIHTCI